MESARRSLYRSPPFTSMERLKKRLNWQERNLDFTKIHEALQAVYSRSELSLSSKRSATVPKRKSNPLTSTQPLREILEREIHKDIARSVHLDSLNLRRVRSSSRIDTVNNLMQQRNLEKEKEQVATLDYWHLTNQAPLQQYGSQMLQQAEELAKNSMTEIMKEQARDRKLIKRNSILLEKLTPSDKLLQKLPSTKQRMKANLPNQIFSNNMDYEGRTLFQYNFLQEKIASNKAGIKQLLKEKSKILEDIYKCKDSINMNQILLQKDTVTDSTDSKFYSSKFFQTPPMDPVQRTYNFQLKEKRKLEIKTIQEQIGTLRTHLEEIERNIKQNSSKLESIKFQLTTLREELSKYYHSLLASGVDTRQEGLVWIIKAIWKIEKSVNISQIPPYIDEKGIEYLFAYARKEIHMQQLKQALRPSWASPGLVPPDAPLSLDKKIETEREIKAIHRELGEMKDREYRRIQREFTLKQYKTLFNVSLLTLMSALFGNEFVSKEMDRLPKKLSTV